MSAGTRVPPHNLEAEASLLGAMLLTANAIDAVAGDVTPEDFYAPRHARIFEVIASLHNSGHPVDTVTVSEEIERRDLTEHTGGPGALTSLQNATPSTTNVARYARIVAELATLRRLIDAAAQIADIGYTAAPEPIETSIESAERILHAVTDTRRHEQLVEHVEPVITRIIDRLAEPPDPTGSGIVTTGWDDFDGLLAGLQPGQLIVIGARPGVGKSALAGNIALNVANQTPVLIASLEMSSDELTQRLLASEGRVALDRIRKHALTERDWERMKDGVAIAALPLYFHDNPAATTNTIAAAARRVSRQAGRPCGLIIVDYVQLAGSPNASKRDDNRQAEVAAVARHLKVIARQQHVPIIALAQLNRGLEHRSDKRPTLADLRESGELEQAADVVVFLYRDEMYNPSSPDRGIAELIVAKQRSGPTGKVRLTYTAWNGRFSPLEEAV